MKTLVDNELIVWGFFIKCYRHKACCANSTFGNCTRLYFSLSLEIFARIFDKGIYYLKWKNCK